MCRAENNQGYIELANGVRRYEDGRVLRPGQYPLTIEGASRSTPRVAADVPLGEGMADQARLAILNRRERIRQAVEDE